MSFVTPKSSKENGRPSRSLTAGRSVHTVTIGVQSDEEPSADTEVVGAVKIL